MPKADDMVYFKNHHKELFMLISRPLMNVKQLMINHIPNYIRSIKLSVAMMISIVNQLKYIEEKMLFVSSWKKC